VLPARASAPFLREAVAAVYRPILARLERDARRAATGGAHGLEHFALSAIATASAVAAASISAATTTARAPGLSAGRAALRVLVSTAGVILLVVGAEGKL
jgi:hypothetical protein